MRTNPALLRDLLGAAILHVRSGRATSRSTLAAALGLAPSTVGLYADQLIDDGYIDESGLVRGAIGRPQRTLAPRPAAGWFAGVEFNAGRLQAVRVDFAGRQVAAREKPFAVDTGTRAMLQEIKATVAALARGAEGPLLAIGVGAPGIVDPVAGVSSHYSLIPDWKNVPIAATLRKRFGVPVTVENNLRAIALAERWFGGGRHLSHYIILGPRSGFGVALVQAGQLARGAHHAAGEIGAWPWPPGRTGTGSGSGELQDAISAPAVWRRLAGVTSRARVPADLRAALGEYAAATGPRWEGVVADFAHVVVSLELMVDPEAFFLHGPLTALGPRFCTAVEQAVRAAAPVLAARPFRVLPSTLGDDAGALGAASLAMEAWTP
ncbi:MAG: ROK family protein [Verrucomicrobiota bacterium]